MDGRRRYKWLNERKPPFRKPPRVSWQPAVPSWEKEFCKVVGSFNWETLLQKQKFISFYDSVINWNDSAGEEAFWNAKKRFWSEINGLSSDASLPDPDLYIDEVNWDLETDPELLADIEREPVISKSEHHDPVIIFGDSLLPKEGYSPTGWGDSEEGFKVPAIPSYFNHVGPWNQNWAGSYDNGAAIGWMDYSNTGWQMNDGSWNAGYPTWGGGWNGEWGWNFPNHHYYSGMGPADTGRGQGTWKDNNVARVDAGGYGTSYGQPSVRQNQGQKKRSSKNDYGQRKVAYWGEQSAREHGPTAKKSLNSRAPLDKHGGIPSGRTSKQ